MRTIAERVDAVRHDVSVAWRSLWRRPGFAVAAVVTLAMGIGANAALFSAVDAVLLRPLPFGHPGGLVSLWGNMLGSSLGDYLQIRNLSRSFGQLGFSRESSVTLTGRGQPEELDAASVSVNLFSLLDISPASGRAFATGEDTPGNDRLVILSDGIWADRFARDPRIIGQSLTVDGVARTVAGIMPPGFRYPSASTQMWIPQAVDASNVGPLWGNGGYRFIGRLAHGATAAQAQSELRRVAQQVRHLNPVWDPITLSLVAIVLAIVAALATYIPARRATRISPAMALRGE